MTYNEIRPKAHRRNIIAGSFLLVSCAICIVMTIIFAYVSSQANKRIDAIREDYSAIAALRDAKVASLAAQVGDIQKKLDSLPDRTANKTADKVKQAVKEDEAR